LQAQESNNSPPTLMQQAYIIAKSLRSASYWLFALTFSLLIFSILAFVSYLVFVTEDVINIITISSLVITIIIAVYIVGWFIIKARHEYSRMHNWNEDYLHSSYTLIFDTTIPKGNTTGERVLSLAKFVFPELREDFVASIWDEPNSYGFVLALVRKVLGKTNKNMNNDKAIRTDFSVDSYILDLVLKTKVGYFIVKDFDNKVVTFENIDMLIAACRKLRGRTPDRSIFRIICVAEQYDEKLLDRESLERSMTEKIPSNLKIDLLNKEPKGYSVLWIS
jgi:hypothetical protein